jgi:hypothetical protein
MAVAIMCRHVVSKKFTVLSEECTASIFRDEEPALKASRKQNNDFILFLSHFVAVVYSRICCTLLLQ